MSKIGDKDIEHLKHVFNLYASKNEKLSIKNLGIAIRALGIPITDPEISEIGKELNAVGNSEIDFPEFLSFVGVKYKNLDLEEVLKQCFELFDRDRNGRISVKELCFVFSNLGYRLEKKDIDMLLKEHNFQNHEELTFPEFYKFMV